MPKIILLLFFIFSLLLVQANRISGIVTDDKGKALPFASILVKGTSKGTTANNEGKYFLELDPGVYIISAHYVGYERSESRISLTEKAAVLNFTLSLQQLSLKEVVVTPGGEDPAYEIIRNAIRKRKGYENPLDSFTCEAYIKTLVKTRKLPKKIFGQKIDEKDKKDMGVDSVGKGIIYLSESLTKVAYKKPNKTKLEVLSGRESGSNGFGFNFPTFINFYSNSVNIFASQLNPRGFVSPISDGAIHYYKYQYLGSFFEDGKEINQIKVTPRRKFEPLFSGTIAITEGDWRIHSLELTLTKESQLEIVDTVRIRQLQVPVTNDVWRTKDQLIYFTFNQFGIDAIGNFLNVYNKYEFNPAFSKRYFNNVVVKYDTAVNKKSRQYWDSVRPVALEPEEAKDYKIKDSVFQFQRDSVWSKRSIDSMKKRQGPVTPLKLLWSGFNRSNFNPKNPWRYTWEPLIKGLQYNTVEGLVINAGASFQKTFLKSKRNLTIAPHLRYGINNEHFNAWATVSLSRQNFIWDNDGGTTGRSTWSLSGGSRVSQFNKANPITPFFNSIYTLLFKQNYLKIYENRFAELQYQHRYDNGLRITGQLLFEDRLPLENTTDFSFDKNSNRMFSPNYPFEKLDTQFVKHQALIAGIDIQFRPGQRYIQFPRNKMAFGSKYPTFGFQYVHGIDKLLGSDVNFDKWRLSVWDDMNLKLKGTLKYRFSIGGFLNSKKVFIQDYQHFNGNQLLFASQYLNSFQLAPYYANSTTAGFYATGHLEHHFNGLLTNKIPLFRRLNWNLVGGGNAFFVNGKNNYVEAFFGLENIFKIARVDFVAAYLNGKSAQTGIRIGFGGLLGSSIRVGR